MVSKNITHDIITNLNITLILFIILRYHTVDYLLKMSDILKIEYDLTLTLTVILPPPTQRCCQACCHGPQGCSYAAALAAETPATDAALVLRCPLHFPHCRHCCAAAAAATLPLPRCHRHCTASATALPPPPHCRCHASRSNAATEIPAALPLLPCCAVAKLLLPPPPSWHHHQRQGCHCAAVLPPPLPPHSPSN
jgi:hypothetical protein